MDPSKQEVTEEEKEKQEHRDTKPRKGRRAGAKRAKDDTLIIKTDESKYSEVLKAMINDAKVLVQAK